MKKLTEKELSKLFNEVYLEEFNSILEEDLENLDEAGEWKVVFRKGKRQRKLICPPGTKADGRCYHCQLNYELDLKFDKPIRWFAYRRLKDFQNMKSIEKDMEQWIQEKHKILQKNPFDMKVANALSNANLEMTINKNKS